MGNNPESLSNEIQDLLVENAKLMALLRSPRRSPEDADETLDRIDDVLKLGQQALSQAAVSIETEVVQDEEPTAA